MTATNCQNLEVWARIADDRIIDEEELWVKTTDIQANAGDYAVGIEVMRCLKFADEVIEVKVVKKLDSS